MNNTSNSNSSVSQDLDGSYAYYSVGLYIGFVLVISVTGLTTYYCSRRCFQNRQRSATANTSLELGSNLTIQVHKKEAIVNSYPVLLYSQAKIDKPDSAAIVTSCCSICLADYKDTDLLQLLPYCGHMFHTDCINKWLKVNLSCPVCRTSPLPTPISTPLAEVSPLSITTHD